MASSRTDDEMQSRTHATQNTKTNYFLYAPGDIHAGVYYKSWLAAALVSFHRPAARLFLGCLSVSIPDRIIHQNRLVSRVALAPPRAIRLSHRQSTKWNCACHKPSWLIHYAIRAEYSLKAKPKVCYFMKMNERRSRRKKNAKEKMKKVFHQSLTMTA